MTATGRLVALRRHPVKGFTPEALAEATLEVGRPFPCDRLFAVEDGPCGFDPDAPAYIPKVRLAVLTRLAAMARIRTAYDEAAGVLTAQAPDGGAFRGRLVDEAGREAFEAWLAQSLDAAEPGVRRGALRVISAPGYSFTDDPVGQVSLLNLATVRDLGARLGRELDPERFRCNLHVEGWPAWAEAGEDLAALRVGEVAFSRIKPIRRCAAIDVDPTTGVRDLELVSALHAQYGHVFCGVYLSVERGGRLAVGDAVGACERE